MEWFPELIAPSKRKPRSENKRKCSSYESITPIDLNQPTAAVPDAVATMETGHCRGSGNNWTVPNVDTTLQSYRKNEQDNRDLIELNKQERKCRTLISPIYPIRTANGLRNDEQGKKNNAQPNATCPTASVNKMCRLRIVSSTTGQEYYVNINNPVGKVQREGQQNSGPNQGNSVHLCPPLVRREGQDKSISKFHFSPKCGGFLTSTPKIQGVTQGNSGTCQVHSFWNPQPSTSGCNPNGPSQAHPFKAYYEGPKKYGTENLRSWETVSEDNFQTSQPLKRSNYLNNCVNMANYGQRYARFPGSKGIVQMEPQRCDEASMTDTEKATLTWSNENVVSQLWSRNAPNVLTGGNIISKKIDAGNEQTYGRLNNGVRCFDKCVRTLGNFGIEQTEIGYGIDGNAVYVKHRGYCLSPQKITCAIQNTRRT
ncbi:hypothetical protein M514_08739 [Trichuris suis]|nr:hypothetical protein M514_08739 [Trichuris suis]